MKFNKVRLLAYGHFTDIDLNFSSNGGGLHIVYGLNEAGKSTALSAVLEFLFGIEARTPLGFLHPYNKLRIGAVFEANGEEFSLIRRKGNANTLRFGDDVQVFEENRLERILGGMEQAVFEQMFGISHERLREGGRALLQGEGDLGELLFSAASGMAGFHRMLAKIDEDSDKLYVPRGSTRKINELLHEFQELKQQLRGATLTASAWNSTEEELQTLKTKKQLIDQERASKEAEQFRLKRIEEALPWVSRRAEAENILRELEGSVLLAPGFHDRRTEIEKRLAVSSKFADSARQEAAQLKENIEKQSWRVEVIALSSEINGLVQALGKYKSDIQERERLTALAQANLSVGKRKAQALPHPFNFEQPGQAGETMLNLPRAAFARIRKLGSKREKAEADLERAENELREKRLELDRAQHKLAGLAAERDPAQLRRTLSRVQKRGDLEANFRKAAGEIKGLEQTIALEFRALKHWRGEQAEFEALVVPGEAAVIKFGKEFTEAKRAINSKKQRIEEFAAELEATETKLLASEKRGQVPTEEDLLSGRRQREDSWQHVKTSWAEDRKQKPRSDKAAEDICGRHEKAVDTTDELADRLRRESDRVAEVAALLAEQEKIKKKNDGARAELTELEQNLQTLNESWRNQWAAVGIEPASTDEMLEWLKKREELLGVGEQLRAKQSESDELRLTIEECRNELSKSLTVLSEQGERAGESLSALIDRAQAASDSLLNEGQQRKSYTEKIDELQARNPGLQEQQAKCAKMWAEWQQQWEESLLPIGLGRTALAEEAEATVTEIEALISLGDEAGKQKAAVRTLEAGQRAFEGEVEKVCQKLGISSTMGFAEAVHSMRQLLADEERKKQAKEALEAQFAEKVEAVRKIEQSHEEDAAEWELILKEAGATSVEELREKEECSQRRRQVEKDIQEYEAQLSRLAGGKLVEEFIAETAGFDADRLTVLVRDLEDEVERLSSEHEQVIADITTKANELEALRAETCAAEVADELGSVRAELASEVENYCRLRVAAVLLRRAVERYRKENQTPILQRAGELFSRLTRGSFSGLRGEPDEDGRPTLFGVRPDMSLIAPTGMSDGTCDQLYLALRLASLEQYFKDHEPMPFIVDDALVNFDNERVQEALKMFAEMSNFTQIIFFTHHKHVVDIARASLEHDRLFVQELGAQH